MKEQFTIGKISFSQEMPEESELWLDRLVERILLKELNIEATLEAKLISHLIKENISNR